MKSYQPLLNYPNGGKGINHKIGCIESETFEEAVLGHGKAPYG